LPRRRADAEEVTYRLVLPFSGHTVESFFARIAVDGLTRNAAQIAAIAKQWLGHRFDLLGSGWVHVTYGMQCRGLEGRCYASGPPVIPDRNGQWLERRILGPNVPESRRVWSLIQPQHVPIDWQLDFKSGYRWSEQTWYRDVRKGHLPGVDIKVPWELARMQHLPQLALAHAVSARDVQHGQDLDVYAAEFRNEILDFIATNPPRWGVNWASTMDVAIRIANWLVAHDILRSHGAQFDSEFRAVFIRSVYEHGCHIAANLEWTRELHGNHYLANIVGLLFVAAYLPRCPETDAWLAFAVQELVSEVNHQFTPDGASFEASTSYHRLSAEMVVYATALTLALPPDKQQALAAYDHALKRGTPVLRPAPLPFYSPPGGAGAVPFPAWYFERLERMAEFTMHVTKPGGRVPQIGDNDSGRFLKLQPVFIKTTTADARRRYTNLTAYVGLPDDEIYWDEDDLDHRHLVAALNGLFDRADFRAGSSDKEGTADAIRCLAGGRSFHSGVVAREPPAAERTRIGSASALSDIGDAFARAPENQGQAISIPAPGRDLREALKTYGYPDFGVFLFRSPRLYLAVRCGSIGQNGIGGHAHNDQLSLELSLDGVDLIADPGTYLYTPLPERRNAYRSSRAHFGPQLEGHEPGRLDLGLFQLGTEGQAECLYFGEEGFAGVWRGKKRAGHCTVQLGAKSIEARYVAHGCRLVRPGAPTWNEILPSLPFSPGYGKLLNPQERRSDHP